MWPHQVGVVNPLEILQSDWAVIYTAVVQMLNRLADPPFLGGWSHTQLLQITNIFAVTVADEVRLKPSHNKPSESGKIMVL